MSKRRRVESQPPGSPACSTLELSQLLRQREVGAVPRQAAQALHFQSFRLQQEWDTLQCAASTDWPSHLTRGGCVRELVGADGLIVALTDRGLCVAYRRGEPGASATWLNALGGEVEVVRSLFYNPARQSLLLVSVSDADEYMALRCREVAVSSIKAKRLQDWRPVFASEALSWPGFIEFDDTNDVVMTYNAETRLYKVWALRDYSCLHAFPGEGAGGQVADVKISPGAILLIQRQQLGRLPVKVLSVRDGAVLAELAVDIDPEQVIVLIELFGRHLLVKQQGSPLLLLDIAAGETRLVPGFQAPLAFIYTDTNAQFLCFHDRCVEIWNFSGELLATISECSAPSSLGFASSIYLTTHQDLMFSYRAPGGAAPACIAVHDCVRGGRLGSICAGRPGEAGALDDLTALFCDEARQEVITGDAAGRVRLWSC